ncbi:hypothetical protein AMTR_s00174p00025070 [Amborella trichopoda]|uniref:Uncharacterized protein n=1 Tax=Amborella trichopoda TaxID=13333 RepID=U5CZB0_AMBTC|nr:hypothetical protein AMTR_s00174p00025070 [Amborella trichopoda]
MDFETEELVMSNFEVEGNGEMRFGYGSEIVNGGIGYSPAALSILFLGNSHSCHERGFVKKNSLFFVATMLIPSGLLLIGFSVHLSSQQHSPCYLQQRIGSHLYGLPFMVLVN